MDNLGTYRSVSIAFLALSGGDGGFDFAFRTPLDIKGGILVSSPSGKLTCAELGQAISLGKALSAERSGKKVLFNCATGLFNLNCLTDNIASIKDRIPVRFSDQDKEAGRYSQAEQSTWEVIGLLENPLVFAINKYDRFLPAKFLMETFIMSGLRGNIPEQLDEQVLEHTKNLYRGMTELLSTRFGMHLSSGKWEPLPVNEVINRIYSGTI